MELIFKTLLLAHVLTGGAGLFTGSLVMMLNKGTKNHFMLGKIFIISMVVSSIVGFAMSILHPNLFLLIVAVFTLYLLGTGQRFLSLKKLGQGQKPAQIDYLLTYSMLLFGLGFVFYGIYLLVNGNGFGSVLLVFGLISLLMTYKDFKLYSGKTKFKNDWMLVHIQRMTGAYIASLTAFLVVNNSFLPAVLAWLLPTIIFTPLIIWHCKKRVIKKSVATLL